MRSNEGLADELDKLVELASGVIPRLRGDKLPGKEREKFADDVTKLAKDFAELSPTLDGVAKDLRRSLFQDGSLPPDHQI